MLKYYIFLFFFLSFYGVFAQAPTYRTSPAVNVYDYKGGAVTSWKMPVHNDTIALVPGTDSIGAMQYRKIDSSVYIRVPSSGSVNKWVKLLKVGEGFNTVSWGDIVGSLSAQTDLLDSLNLKLNKSDSTIYYSRYDADTSRDNIYAVIDGLTDRGLTYTYSTTPPIDTGTLWVKTPIFCGVYDVFINTGSWQRFGWLAMDGKFSRQRPINIVIAGQSNAAGIYSGGDTARVQGILGFSTGAQNDSIDAPTAWFPTHIGLSPFFSDNNNMAFAFAKEAIARGDAGIARVITTYAGGIGLPAWIGSGDVYLLDTLRSRLSRSGIDTIDVFMWHHGESGGITPSSGGGYYTDLGILLDTLDSPLTSGYIASFTKFICGGLGSATDSSTFYTGADPEGSLRRMNNDRRVLTGYTPSWSVPLSDAVHFSGAGLDIMGRRYYAVSKSMPHNLFDETPKFTYDVAGSKDAYLTSNIGAYLGGTTGTNIQGVSYGYFNNAGPIVVFGGSTGTTSFGLSGYPYSAPTVSINGNLGVYSGNNNLHIAGNYSVTGTLQNNTIIANYATAYNRAGTSSINNVLVGSRAGYTTTKDLNNVVIIGAGAGEFISGGGFGDFFTIVGQGAGRRTNARWASFYGSSSGDSTGGVGISLYGYNTRGKVGLVSYDSSSGFGIGVMPYKSHQGLFGDTTLTEFKMGPWAYLLSRTPPSNGNVNVWNSSNNRFEVGAIPAPSLTSGEVPYGSGSNLLTSEAAFNYNASTNVLSSDSMYVNKISIGGASSNYKLDVNGAAIIRDTLRLSVTRPGSLGDSVLVKDAATGSTEAVANKIPLSGTVSQVGTATTTFTVTIGTTMTNTDYRVPTPGALNVLSAALCYITNKTTTTFDVVYLAGLTGTVSFDWILIP